MSNPRYDVAMTMRERNNVNVNGSGRPMLFAHGFGCDQEMWRFVAPEFEAGFQTVLYDLTGFGKSDLNAYDFDRYNSLDAHADDILKICEELDLRDVVLVGHSVSATISVLAANAEPNRFASLILVAPSPCFLNDGDYKGGFDMNAIEGLIDAMAENYLGWSQQMAPTIAGQPPEGQASQDLTASFCRTDPQIARHFGRLTFLADNRDDMKKLNVPCLIIQCKDDPIAPNEVGAWMHDNVPTAKLEVVPVTGHCPHITAPQLTVDAINRFLGANGH